MPSQRPWIVPVVAAAIITMSVLLLVVAANAMGQDTAKQSPKQSTSPGNAVSTSQSDVENNGAAGTPCLFDAEPR